MKYISILFAIFVNQYSFSQDQDSLFNVTVSQQVEELEKNDKELSKAVEKLSNFLYQRNKKLIYEKEKLDTNYVNFIFDNLFIYNLDNKYLNFHIFSSEKIKEAYYIEVLLQYNFSEDRNQEDSNFFLYYIYEAKVIKKNEIYYIDISVKERKKKKYNQICYNYNLDKKVDKKNIKKASHFLKTLEEKFSFKQKKELTYYVNNWKNAYSPFRFSYNILTTSMFSNKTNFIITTGDNETNKQTNMN